MQVWLMPRTWWEMTRKELTCCCWSQWLVLMVEFDLELKTVELVCCCCWYMEEFALVPGNAWQYAKQMEVMMMQFFFYTRRCGMKVEWKWISCRWKLVCSRVQAVQAGRREVEWNCRHGCGMKFELQFKWWIYAEKEEQKQVEAVRLHQVCGGCYESVIDFGEVNSRCWQEFTEKTEYKTEQNKVALVVVVQVELQWNYGPSSELVSHGLFNC